jgi:hypothetical protein
VRVYPNHTAGRRSEAVPRNGASGYRGSAGRDHASSGQRRRHGNHALTVGGSRVTRRVRHSKFPLECSSLSWRSSDASCCWVQSRYARYSTRDALEGVRWNSSRGDYPELVSVAVPETPQLPIAVVEKGPDPTVTVSVSLEAVKVKLPVVVTGVPLLQPTEKL